MKTKNDGRDKYRKRFSPVIKRDLQVEVDKFYSAYKKIPAKPLYKRSTFIFTSLENNDTLRIILMAKPEALRPYLIELGSHGADISKIYNQLTFSMLYGPLHDIPPEALRGIYGGELNSDWNKKVEEWNDKKKKFSANQKALNGAMRLLSFLEAITLKGFDKTYFADADLLPHVNAKLSKMQNSIKEFQRLLDIYLEALAVKKGLFGYALKWGWNKDKLLKAKKAKPVTQSSHIDMLNRRVFNIVEELKTVEGYTDKKIYETVATLLHITFPDLIKDTDPDLIRNRYCYFKKANLK